MCVCVCVCVSHLYLSQCVLQVLGVGVPAGPGRVLLLLLAAQPGVERHRLVLVLLGALQQPRQTAAQLRGLQGERERERERGRGRGREGEREI